MTTLSIEAAFAPFTFPAVGQRGDGDASVRGHAAGYAAGRKQAEQQLESLRAEALAEVQLSAEKQTENLERALASLARAAEELRGRDAAVIETVETAIANAAIELAEAIIGRELNTDDDSARATVERAIHAGGAASGTSIRLNPDDIAALGARGSAASDIDFVADSTLERGDAVVTMPNGSLDVRISSALARAKAALAEGAR